LSWCFLSLLMGCISLVSCSVKPQFFGKKELDPTFITTHLHDSEWSAYEKDELAPDQREKVLEDDPSRGVGLKQANSMGGGEAPILPGTKLRVFLLMGQSNMVGHGKADKLVPPYNEPHPRIRIWARGKWQYLIPKSNFGPEVSFAHELATLFPSDTIGIIKVAVGGTGMNAWKPDWEWSAASKTGDALKGSLYRDMVNAFAGAHEVSDFQLCGLIWKQGDRDARNLELSESYQDRFVELVKHLRADLATPELPVFVLTYFDEAGIEIHRELVEKLRPNGLPLYVSQAKVSDYLKNAFPVFHGLLPTIFDQVHFNTEGQITLGKMTAAAVANYYLATESGTKNSKKIQSPPIP
jgi:Carbohydrate esterase, sialic acid-specific acetylesterase